MLRLSTSSFGRAGYQTRVQNPLPLHGSRGLTPPLLEMPRFKVNYAHSKPRSSTVEHSGTSNPSLPRSRTSLSMPARRRQRRHDHGALALTPSRGSSALDGFFANHPQFNHDATNSASHEFYRLCDEFGWGRDDPKRKKAHQNFKDALVQEFNQVYGTDEGDLRNWQNLCYIVQIVPVPDDLKTCREAIRGTFVNLVDLVDRRDVTGQEVRIFETELELSQYTTQTGKFFPRKNAYAGGLLRYLLRHILCPATEVPSRGRKKKHH